MKTRYLAATIAVVAVISACSGSEEPAATTTSTTMPPVTTTARPTTTTVPFSVTLAGAPAGLEAVVEGVYEMAAGGDAVPDVADGLARHLAAESADTVLSSIAGEASLGEVLDTPIAVVTAGDDVVLAVGGPGDSWSAVGAKLPSLEIPAWYGESPRQVFIIGSDARPDENPLLLRADSLHIVSMVPEEGVGSIVGIPRDSYVVDASTGGQRKFTNVMASKGPEVVVDTAEGLTDLEFEGYVITGFKGFVEMVDAMGGFEFDVPFAMNEPKSKAYFSAGPQHFDGADALAFARNRTLAGGDLTRSLHHGLLMQFALADIQRRGISELPGLLEALTASAFTDLTPEALLTLAATAYELDPQNQIVNLVVPGSPGMAGSASVVYLADGAFDIFADLQDGILEIDEE